MFLVRAKVKSGFTYWVEGREEELSALEKNNEEKKYAFYEIVDGEKTPLLKPYKKAAKK